jgi:hypothetical protein
MTHHAPFPPYLPRGKIDGESHPVDAAKRPVLRQTIPGIEHHVLAIVQRILRQTLPWNGDASQPYYSLLRTGPPRRTVLDVIRRGGVTANFIEDASADVAHELVPVHFDLKATYCPPHGEWPPWVVMSDVIIRLSSPKADVVANLWDVAIASQLGPCG